MYLERFELWRAPGISRPIILEGLKPGLVLLVGGNASGKSTIGRTIGGTLWRDAVPAGVGAYSSWRLSPSGPLMEATLSFGQINWDGEGWHPPGELRASWQLNLRDMMSAGPKTDQGIAKKIQRELDGGYDLSCIGMELGRVRPLPSVKKPYEEASRQLRSIAEATDGLADKERGLADLKAKIQAAQVAPKQLELMKKAKRRLELLEKKAGLEVSLAELPDSLASLPSEAATKAKELVTKEQRRRGDLKQRESDLAEANETCSQLVFPNGDPGELLVEDWGERATLLTELNREFEQFSAAALKAESRAEALSNQVWASDSAGGVPPKEVMEGLDLAVQELAAARAKLAGLVIVAPPEAEPLGQSAYEELREARSLLRRWFLIPRVELSSTKPAKRTALMTALMLLGACLLLLGLGLAVLVSPWAGAFVVGLGALAVGVGLGLFVGPAEATRPSAVSSEVQALERQYGEAGYSPPEHWNQKGVSELIKRLDGGIRDRDQALDQTKLAVAAGAKRAKAEQEIEKCETALMKCTELLTLRSDIGGLALVVQADRIRKLADGRVAEQTAQSARSATQVGRDDVQNRLVVELEALGLSDLPTLDNAGSVSRVVSSIRDRRKEWLGAVKEEQTAQVEFKKAEEELVDATQERDEYLRRCGVELTELSQLEVLSEQRGTWQGLVEELRDTEREVGQLEPVLPAGLPGTVEAVDSELERLEQLGDKLDDLQAKAAEIDYAIEQVTEGSSVQDTVAAEKMGLDKLAEDRELQMSRHISGALVRWLRKQRGGQDAPKLLARARDWFLRFTNNRYELVIGDDRSFEAEDHHTNRRQSLPELSDGTRVQLLLAARLSFIECTEGEGNPTPLFLDELLSTTYMDRFKAVASAVLELSSGGRQVFYATGDLYEVSAWKALAQELGYAPPQVAVIGDDSSAADWEPAPMLPGLMRELPTPAGQDAIQYTASLGFSRPKLHDVVDTWPLSLVLYDQLLSVHQAAQQGVRTVGQLRLADLGVVLPLTADDLNLVRARVQGIQSCLSAFQVGRGRPPTWDDVEASGAVNSTFADRVKKLLADHGADARGFVSSLTTIQRFEKRRLKLVDYLESVDVHDSKEPLSNDVVVQRTQLACRDAIAVEAISLADVEDLVRFVAEVVQLGS